VTPQRQQFAANQIVNVFKYDRLEASPGTQKAQGESPGVPPEFYNHYIVRYAGLIYDPSYGKGPFGSGPNSTERAWEDGSLTMDASIDGFEITLVHPDTNAKKTFVRKNDLNKKEITSGP
jgi:hypothetical protein